MEAKQVESWTYCQGTLLTVMSLNFLRFVYIVWKSLSVLRSHKIPEMMPLKNRLNPCRRKSLQRRLAAIKQFRAQPRKLTGEIHEERILRSLDGNDPPWYILCFLDEGASPVKFFLCTGNEISSITRSCVERLGLSDKVNWSERQRYLTIYGQERWICGRLHVPVMTASGSTLLNKIFVVEEERADCVLGGDFFFGSKEIEMDLGYSPKLIWREREARLH